jgi:DNA polymerase
MNKLTIDFETRSAAPIKTVGAAAYAQHPTTEVICLALKWGDTDPVIWYSPSFREQITFENGRGVYKHLIGPEEVVRMMQLADEIEAHNAQFEYFIWKYVMPKYGFAMFDTSKLHCSAAKAAMYGLPRDLAGACAAAGVSQQKDMEGSRLMMRLCQPRKALKEDKLRDPDWETRLYWRGTPEEFVRLGEYCLQDVRAEEALSNALPPLPATEQKLWLLDLAINDRGIRVDAPSAQAILAAVDRHAEAMTAEFKRMTGLSSPRQRDALLAHLVSLGVQMEGLTANDVAEALNAAEEGTQAKRLLEIRQSLSKSSTAKYNAFLQTKGEGDRIRGCFMYHGAGTGRWSGRLIQPQNFPRGAFGDVDECIRLFRKGSVEAVSELYGDPMVAASTCLRGMIVPAEGKDFICADYSSIEGRVLAWIAEEEGALDVYRRGEDPYKVAASAIYHVPYGEVSKPQRQIGKVAELACGYQGGSGAFNAMAAVYGVSLSEAEIADIVSKWRDSRPLTVQLWAELENACKLAIKNPGKAFAYKKIRFIVRGRMLAMGLPSGRCLWYANPRIESKEMKWGGDKRVIAFDGVNSMTRKWGTQYLYGGLLAENATQANSRDILVNGLFNAEGAGYPTVLHVHDEACAEVPEGFGSVETYEKLLCTLPAWAEGLPLKAEGWRGKRYRK